MDLFLLFQCDSEGEDDKVSFLCLYIYGFSIRFGSFAVFFFAGVCFSSFVYSVFLSFSFNFVQTQSMI